MTQTTKRLHTGSSETIKNTFWIHDADHGLVGPKPWLDSNL